MSRFGLCFVGSLLFVSLPVCVIAQPQIVVDPEAVEDELFTGGRAVHELNVANPGDDELVFSTRIDPTGEPGREIPGGEDLGEVLDQFQLPYNNIGGLAWDGVNMWACSYNSRRLMSLDPNDQRVVSDFPVQFSPIGMTWIEEDGVFWLGAWGRNEIMLYDREGQLIERRETHRQVNGGLANDGEFVYWNSELDYNNTGDDRLYKMNMEGEILGEVANLPETVGHTQTVCIEWVEQHQDGHFWVICRDGFIAQVDVDFETGEIEVIREFRANHDNRHNAIAHDGYNLWAGGRWNDRNVFIYHDEIEEIHWMDVDPREGTVAADGEFEMSVTFDCAGLQGGDYEGELHFLTNDPATPDLALPVMLHVTGAAAVVASWDSDFGYPDGID